VRSIAVRRPSTAAPWQVQFVLLAAIWGASFLFIKVLDRHWPALWVSLGRVALGAAALVVLVVIRREQLPRHPKVWLHCAVAAVLFNAVPWTLFAYGEQHTSSIVAGLWNATTPLWVLIISLAAFGEERPTAARVAGLATGFAGVALLLGPWRGFGGGQVLGNVCCAGAALCYGFGFPYTRRYLAARTESGVVLSAAQLLCATAMLAAFVPLARAPTTHIGLDGAGSLLALGALGSGVAFAINYAIVRARGAGTASIVAYLIPVFSTILGVAVLSETLHWNQPVGTVVLLAGVAISQRRFASRRPLSVRPVPGRG
jgi:drug/metabolite transporter (DMT)-like permease